MIEYVEKTENKLDEMTKFFIFNQEEFKAELDSMLKMATTNLQMLADAHNTIESQKQQLLDKEEEVQASQKAHNTTQDRVHFIERILSAKAPLGREKLSLKPIIEGDFIRFSNMNLFRIEDSQAMKGLLELDRKLQQIIAYPEVYTKRCIAIGGAKGSGKREFLGAFFCKESIKLPATEEYGASIATYILNEATSTIQGCNYQGGSIAMTPELYEVLASDYSNSFGFALHEILPAVILKTPINQEYFKHICIVDTPLFVDEKNIHLSYEYQNRHDITSLIWVVDAKNDSLDEGQLKLLKLLADEQKEIYIVAYGTELLKEDQIKSLLSKIKATLQKKEISFVGIAAFSKSDQKEMLFAELSLYKFLANQNKPLLIQEELISQLYKIFDLYREGTEKSLKEEQTISKQFDLLELDLKEEGLEDNNGIVSLRVSILRKLSRQKELKENLKMVDVTQEKFISAINKVFGKRIGI